MNIGIADSFSLLRTNVNEGGESIKDLNEQLGKMKDLSRTGTQSLPAIAQQVAATSAAGVAAGMPGAQATRAAEVFSQWWSGDQALKGQGSVMAQQLASDPGKVGGLLGLTGTPLPPGMMPQTYWARLGANGGQGQSQLISKALKVMAKMASGGNRDEEDQVAYFAMIAHNYFPNAEWTTNLSEAKKVYDGIRSGEDPDVDAEGRVNKSKSGGGIAGFAQKLLSSSIETALTPPGKNLWDAAHRVRQGVSALAGGDLSSNIHSHGILGGLWDSAMEVFSGHGPGGDGSGGGGGGSGGGSDGGGGDNSDADTPGPGWTGGSHTSGSSYGGSGSSGSNVHGASYRTGGAGSSHTVSHVVELRPTGGLEKVVSVPPPFPITQNEQASNQGSGQTTRNNPPAGDGTTGRAWI
jgi:hypothetical protein